MIDWEGAELCLYFNGESYSIDLSDMQFAVLVKILGMKINADESFTFFTDETLKQFTELEINPLKFFCNE